MLLNLFRNDSETLNKVCKIFRGIKMQRIYEIKKYLTIFI